jgi:hypothetical protein
MGAFCIARRITGPSKKVRRESGKVVFRLCSGMPTLPAGYVPSNHDVIMGRGKVRLEVLLAVN